MTQIHNKLEALHSLLKVVTELIKEEEAYFDCADVIRCKNCKYNGIREERYCWLDDCWIEDEEGFCSYAERKDDATN